MNICLVKDKVAYGAKTTTLIDIRRASVYFQYLGVNGYCWFLMKVEKRITRRKTSQNKGEIQRQIQCTNLHMTPGDPGHIPRDRYHTADVMLSASQVMLLIGLFETISDTTGLIYISFQLRCSWQILYFHRNVLEDVAVVRHIPCISPELTVTAVLSSVPRCTCAAICTDQIIACSIILA